MLDKLRKSQNEYLELLRRVRGDLDLGDVAYHLDKIRIFGLENKITRSV